MPATVRLASYVDTSQDIADRPAARVAKELSRFEDPLLPERPEGTPRLAAGKWAPPLPEPEDPPELVVIGLGRQMYPQKSQGPRTRLGAGALEALQHRYSVTMHFDLETKGYVSKCRASLDKSGRAGVQDITMFQPVVDMHGDVGNALSVLMSQKRMDKAMVLIVLSDWRLPFGQMRLRTAFDESDPRIKSAYLALGPEQRISFLNIGVGHEAADKPFSPQEAAMLPRILANAASAIELWISEVDLGLVMRFINRPALYELSPASTASRAAISEASTTDQGDAEGAESAPEAAIQAAQVQTAESSGTGLLMSPSADDDNPAFVLFDCSRDESYKLPKVNSAPLPTQLALATLQERPGCEGLIVAGRRFASLARLEADVIEMVLEHRPGKHLRLQDDEDLAKALFSFHPDADRLMEDLVAVKVDCSPVDDHTKCLWVIKFDGYEEDVSLQTCFSRLREYVTAQEVDTQLLLGTNPRHHRLGPGRWGRAVRESTFDRAKVQEALSRQVTQ